MAKRDLTSGSIIKSIIFLAIPILIGNLLQTAYNLTDAFWVGRLGADAIASVSLSFPILFLIIAFSGGIGLGGAVLVAQYKGRKDKKNINHVSGQTFLLAFSASIILSIIGFYFSPQIVKLFGADINVFNGAVSYLRVSFAGTVFVFGYLVYQSLSRAVGDVKTPVYIVLATVLLNFLLDPLFIFGFKLIPAMGVSGAAMATVLTQTVALFSGLIILYRGKAEIHIKLHDFKPDFRIIKKIVGLGIPLSIEQSTRSFGFILMTAIATGFGTIVLASYGLGGQLMSLIIIPALSISIANSTLVGQNIGAGKIDRAEKVTKTSLIISFIILTIVGILFFIFSRQICTIFIPGDEQVINSASLFIKIIALSFGFIGTQFALFGTLRGSGNASTTMKISILTLIIQVGSAFFLSKFFNEIGIWIAFPIANILGFLIVFFVYKKGDWKNKRILDEPETKKEIKKEVLADKCE